MENKPFNEFRYDRYWYSIYQKDPLPEKVEPLLPKLQADSIDDVLLVHKLKALKVYKNKAIVEASILLVLALSIFRDLTYSQHPRRKY